MSDQETTEEQTATEAPAPVADVAMPDDAGAWKMLTPDQVRPGMYLRVHIAKEGQGPIPYVYEVTSTTRDGNTWQVYCRHLDSGRVGVVELADGQSIRTAGADRAKSMARAKRERPQAVAASKGAWSAHPACTDLWKLSKRELLEAALHCASMSTDSYAEGGAEQAAKALRQEITTLRENELI